MGFGVPETNCVEGYLECLKTVVRDILPWDEFFSLITSIVTDGEPLNMGRLNGLCAKLKGERLRSAHPELPLYCVWCVPHRINLAWKSTSKIAIIKKINDLIVAAVNNLDAPLNYPAFFEIR